MPTPLGYLIENSFTPYPFKDGCSLIPITSAVPIDNDIFVDFQFVTTDTEVRGVALRQLHTSMVTHELTFTFAIFKYNTSTAEWTTVYKLLVKPLSAIEPYDFFSVDWTEYKAKLVLGPGITGIKNRPSFIIWRFAVSAGGASAAEFSPATIIPVHPFVSAIRFKNIKEVEPVAVFTLETRTLTAGTNLVISEGTDGADFVIERGTGAGLYDICADAPSDVLKSINDVEGENIIFTSDDCYKTKYHPLLPGGSPTSNTPGIEFEQICRPRCNEVEVNAFAYYANRVQDAVNQLGGYITTVVEGLNESVAEISAAKAPQIISPYLEIQTANTVSSSKNYQSVAVGIYDPNRKKLVCDLTAYLSSAEWVLYDNKATLEEGNNAYILTPTIAGNVLPIFTARRIDCRDSVLVYFVLTGPTTLSNQRLKVALLSKDDTAVTETACNYHMMLPLAGPYFNVKSRGGALTVGATTTFVHTISVDLFDTNISWSGDTSLTIGVDNDHTILHTVVWRINNEDAITAVAINETDGANSIAASGTILYPQRAQLTFQLSASTSKQVTLDMHMNVGTSPMVTETLTFL